MVSGMRAAGHLFSPRDPMYQSDPVVTGFT
jgi:hypothetical protein